MTLLIDIRGGMSLDGKFPALRVGDEYYGRVTASGGTPFYTYAIIKGALPAGLTFDTITGEITGTPTDNKMAAITVRATDLQGMSVERVFVIPGTQLHGLAMKYTDIWEYKVIPASQYVSTDTYRTYDGTPWQRGAGGFGTVLTGGPSTGTYIASGPVNQQIFIRGIVFAGQEVTIAHDDRGRAWVNDNFLFTGGWTGGTGYNTATAKEDGVLVCQCINDYNEGNVFIGANVENP